MMRLILAFCAALLLAATTPPVSAQDMGPATLVADNITFNRERLIAEGGVEIFADGRVLRARRLTYLRPEDRLIVQGPLTLLDGPDTIIVADFASLGSDLRNSILEGARLVLDQQLQIAAAEISTGDDDRFVQLSRTVASSCEVCAGNPVPLWQIRAERIIHDREENQLYFENARFEVAGVPIAFLPRFRVPDPTVERATGLLVPRFSTDDQLGTGVALPYFIALGPSRDLTLIPFVTTTETVQLGFRYRQAFDNGAIRFDGAVARDDIRPGDTRGFFFADGVFFLPRDYRLEFDVELVTDDTYLLDYNVSEKDRLDSRIALARVDRTDRFLAEVTAIRTLRAGEDSSFLPTRILTVERQAVRTPPVVGGQLTWTFQGHARERPASTIPPGFPLDATRDALRFGAGLDWRQSNVLPSGIVATVMGSLELDAYAVRQDPEFADDETFVRAVPRGGIEFRLPLVRQGQKGVHHVLEPVAQLVFSPDDVTDAPDEDSLTPEFDGGNLFSADRFAGRDERELGNRLNVGLAYQRVDPGGLQLGGLVGRIIREEDLEQFDSGTGLDSSTSDWLVSGTVRWKDRFELLTRSLFDGDLQFSRSETILRYQGDRLGLATRYSWLEEDVEQGRPADTSEWILDASLDLRDDWTARGNWRYDFITDDPTRAGVGLTYRTECVTVDFDVERRFTSNVVLEPSTRFGFGVELVGFGADDRGMRSRRCGL